jgi:multidrug efflux pump subunit AcrA (membrane-fusion protein)
MMPREPISKTRVLQESPDAAYQRAARVLAQMGGELTFANPQSRMLSAKLKGVVVLTVQVQPTEGGASVEATGTLVPGKVVLGSLTEVDDYLARLH